MGRKRKYGEKSKMVSVHVPESKEKEYRREINKFVDEKFEKNGKLALNPDEILPEKEKKPFSNSNFEQENSDMTQTLMESKEFQDLREFVKKLYKDQEEREKIKRCGNKTKKKVMVMADIITFVILKVTFTFIYLQVYKTRIK